MGLTSPPCLLHCPRYSSSLWTVKLLVLHQVYVRLMFAWDVTLLPTDLLQSELIEGFLVFSLDPAFKPLGSFICD
jgi:hypothetical protein